MKNCLSQIARKLFLGFGMFLSACNAFLEVDLPPTLISQHQVFNDEISATSAVKGLYVDLLDQSNFASGSDVSAASLTGLSSDELHNYSNSLPYIAFEQNDIAVDNPTILSLWTSLYKTIYDSNSVIEGLRNSSVIGASIKNQLLGEALFIRAYCYFYLINLFGDVPLLTSTDYRTNAIASRTPVDSVYGKIKDDLEETRILLNENYEGAPERIRVNKFAAAALLSRVYLYLREWEMAESMATVVIQKGSLYQLEPLLEDVFLVASTEAIWQLQLPSTLRPYYTTFEGFYFIVESDVDLQYSALNEDLIRSFEPGDLRRASWVGTYATELDTIHFPYKYKVKRGSITPSENSSVLRLAEQFLIRAEARVHLTKINEAIADLDLIRKRAGLTLIKNTNPSIEEGELLATIDHERRVELFTEGAHRWFDLKRTERVDQALSTLKTNWESEDALYPIPLEEFKNNPSLGNQNPGY